ncbi:MAG: PEP-CTERM sorting domain-containing protein [bacterium]
MKRFAIIAFTLLFVGIGITSASATSSLWDWAFYIDGTTFECYLGDSMPATGVPVTFDIVTGLGTLTWETNVAGMHSFIAFFDHDIEEDTNTFFNEYGVAIGDPAAGQSWEIDDPFFGNIYYNNVLTGSLDNSNEASGDVSLAMGWNFNVPPGQTATIELILANNDPLSGFYLSQTDSDSLETIYFSSTLTIEGGGPAPVPEPGTWLLLCCGLIGLFGFGRKRLIKG